MAQRLPRLIISTEGMESSGKTDFALSAPRPLTMLDFDYGTEGVRRDAPDTHILYNLAEAEWLPDAQAKRLIQSVMQKFVTDFRAAIKAKVRSLVVDTFTRAWSGQRIARADDKYADMEEEFLSLIGLAYGSPHTNLILVHHMRQDWARDQAGKAYKAKTWSRDSMDNIAAKVQLAIRQRYVQPTFAGNIKTADGRFEIDILKCRDNVGLTGTTWPGLDFASLGAMVAPTVDWSK